MTDPAASTSRANARAKARAARQNEVARTLELLQAGLPVRDVKLALEAEFGSVRRRPGPAARPFDETRALELLRAGWPAYKVRDEVGAGSLRKIVAPARENGISLHLRRTNRTLRRQERIINRLRFHGWSWEQIAAKLGYGRGAVASIKRRAERESLDAGIRLHAKTRAALMKRLRALNSASGLEDVDAFVRLAADPRRHWLLPPGEIAIARHFRLLRNAQ